MAGIERIAGVDLGGLTTVLSSHLYSTPDVALRELVQNAHDAIARRRLEDDEWPDTGGRILVKVDPDAATIELIDDGAGLTEPEIDQYLATIGSGYTRLLRERHDPDLIGYFGLGFLSAFVIAERVVVETTSHRTPDQGWRYSSASPERYQVEPIEARPVGSRVVLHLGESGRHLVEPGAARRLLIRHCGLLDVDIFLGDAPDPLNEVPPWRRSGLGSLDIRAAERAFAERFEPALRPLTTMSVRPSPEIDVAGVLWVQGHATYGTSDNRNLSVFVRSMLLDGDARNLLPSWAGFVGGVVECDALVPTASREAIQTGPETDAVAAAIEQQLVTGLVELASDRPAEWSSVLERHGEALIGAAIADERLLDALGDQLRLATSHGPMTAGRLLDNPRRSVHVNLGPAGGIEEIMFRALGIPVARGSRFGVATFLREWATRNDAQLVELGTAEGLHWVFGEAELPDDERERLERLLADPGEALIPARFEPAVLPLVSVIDEEARLKASIECSSAERRVGTAALALARAHTATIEAGPIRRVYCNLSNPSIQLLRRTHDHPEFETAVRLLRAGKVLVSASSDDGETHDVASAMGDLGTGVERLLATDRPTPHSPMETPHG